MNIKEYFNNKYTEAQIEADTQEEFNSWQDEIWEEEVNAYFMPQSEFKAWAETKGIDLNALDNGVSIVDQWAETVYRDWEAERQGKRFW